MAIDASQEETGREIRIPQPKYLNKLVEQDRQAVKQNVRPVLGSNHLARPGLLSRGSS